MWRLEKSRTGQRSEAMSKFRMAICALVSFEVASFGGVEPWSVGVLEISAAALLLFWGIRSARQAEVEVQWNWLYLPMLALAVVALGQTIFGYSVYLYATQTELLKWIAYLMLCFLAAQAFRTKGSRNNLLWFLVCLVFVCSVFSIVQALTFDGRLYWSIPLPAGAEPFGPFVNRDHFAGFIELTAPMGLALIFEGAYRKDKKGLIYLFTLLPIGALALSASRGGIVGFMVALAIVATLSYREWMKKTKAIEVLTLGVLAGSFIVWLGASRAIARFRQSTASGVTTGMRSEIASDAWKIFIDHPWTGSGLGTFETVFPRYASFYDKKTVDHAHNDYLEILSETGITGGLFGFAFIVTLYWQGMRNLRLATDAFDRAFHVGAMGSCTAILVHSLVDFNLHIPANALLFLLLATLATAHKQRQNDRWKGEPKAETNSWRELAATDGPRQRFVTRRNDSVVP
jgi:O-antigen ligase